MSVTIEMVARDEYTEFCAGVQRLCQLDLTQYKRNQMERRIRSFAERRGKPTLREYLLALRYEESELSEFLDRVTINVSQLWRNPSVWATLRREVIPELASGPRLAAWSAGCSYGAEAYTLAAICRDVAPAVSLQVRGTDIDARMIKRARLGHFSDEDAREAPATTLKRWFERADDGWSATAELRSVVNFEVGDLLAMNIAKRSYDLILCRNTVIYFTEDVRNALHARLACALRPGGYLVVGSTERIVNAEALELSLVHPFIYRKS
jgi:chemotaxis protein methyltransferase CheR